MGGGIAQVSAQAGYDVIIQDLSDDIIEKGLKAVQWSVGKLIEKGRVQGTVEEVMGRIRPTTDLLLAEEADFVFEAIVEDIDTKKDLFSKLDEICPANTIFASNTSAIPITDIAEATKRGDRFIGTHFFNPVPMMRVMEIVRGLLTSDETMDIAESIGISLGKEPIRVNRDVAGFALNRINYPSFIEAIKLVEAGIVNVEDVDKGMRLGFGRPMGLFETSDLTGLNISLNAMKAIYKETQDEKFYPPMLLQRKVKIGHLGRKTGIGWYKYDENGKKIEMAEN